MSVWIIAYLSSEDALAQPLVPSTEFADAWIQVDRTEDPRFFVNLLDAIRARLLERARTTPREFCAVGSTHGLNVLDVGCGTGTSFACWLGWFFQAQPSKSSPQGFGARKGITHDENPS